MIHSMNLILSLLYTYCLLAKNSYDFFKFSQRRSGSSKNLENSSAASAPPRTMLGSLQCSPRPPSRLGRGHFGCGANAPSPSEFAPVLKNKCRRLCSPHHQQLRFSVLCLSIYISFRWFCPTMHKKWTNEPEYLQMSIFWITTQQESTIHSWQTAS